VKGSLLFGNSNTATVLAVGDVAGGNGNTATATALAVGDILNGASGNGNTLLAVGDSSVTFF
jgi:hypothetical protein